MANKETSSKTGYVVDVKIVDVEKRYKTGPKHYVYVIKVTWANPANLFIIYRRYAQFFDLQCKLLDLFGQTPVESDTNAQSRPIPFLPGKIVLGRSQIRQIAIERKQVLHDYCQSLISLPERVSRSRPILEFFHPLSTDIQRPMESAIQEKKPVDKSSLVISGPTQLPTYRCLADFTATEKLEMSLKRNNMVQVLQKHPNGWWFVQFNDQTGFVPGAYLEPSELKRGAREGKVVEKLLNATFVVNSTYEAKDKDELSLEQGSFVTVIEKSLTGWWKIKFNNRTGHFPAVYLTSCDGRRTPESLLDDDGPSNNSKKKELSKDDESDEDVEDDYHLDPAEASESELYYAHTDFNDNIGNCLSFKRGDIIEVHDKHQSGWWFGRRMKGDPILSWVPANYLQKEPIIDSTAAYCNIETVNSKIQTKTPDTGSTSSVKTKQNEEKTVVSTTTVRKNFDSQPSPNQIDRSKIIKKQQPIETTTAARNSPVATPAAFRSVNGKHETTAVPKSSSATSSSPFRPVGVKQDTPTATSKSPPITSSTGFRSVGGNQQPTTTSRSTPVSTSTAFRPVGGNQQPIATPRSTPASTSTVFRPVGGNQQTTPTPRSTPVSTSTAFRPIGGNQQPAATPKSPSVSTSTAFRPTSNDQQPATTPKNPWVSTSTAFRPTGGNQQPATTPKSPSVSTSTAFRSAGKDQQPATTPKNPWESTSTAFRPIGGNQQPATTPKSPSASTSTAFRPAGNDQQPSTTSSAFRSVNNRPYLASPSKTSPITTSSPFRPATSQQETTTPQKRPPVTNSTPLRPINDKQEPTQKSVKDLLGRFNPK